jgi:mannose-6-phosphate isomerase
MVAMGTIEERPWGSFSVLDDADNHKVKRMVIDPGKRLSLQRHTRRAEHWFVVSGHGQITLDDRIVAVGPGDAVDIAMGTAHRAACDGEVPLVFIEVQSGEYFGEDDIVRLEDDFGRVG